MITSHKTPMFGPCMAFVIAALVLTTVAFGFIYPAWSEEENEQTVYYRYTNDRGIRVIEHTISPKYAQKGYEIVTLSGRVLKVVPPAPSKEEAASILERKREAEKLAKWDADLRRRYSSVGDIVAAKERKLKHLEGNVSVLHGNANGLRTHIQAEQAKAANFERSGRTVPEYIHKTIADLQAELKVTEDQISIRMVEVTEVEARFNRDIERFKRIHSGS